MLFRGIDRHYLTIRGKGIIHNITSGQSTVGVFSSTSSILVCTLVSCFPLLLMSYDCDVLLSIRDSPTVVRRDVRKTLFKFGIWNRDHSRRIEVFHQPEIRRQGDQYLGDHDDGADCERSGVCMDNLIKITTSTPRNGISAAVKVECVNVQSINRKLLSYTKSLSHTI